MTIAGICSKFFFFDCTARPDPTLTSALYNKTISCFSLKHTHRKFHLLFFLVGFRKGGGDNHRAVWPAGFIGFYGPTLTFIGLWFKIHRRSCGTILPSPGLFVFVFVDFFFLSLLSWADNLSSSSNEEDARRQASKQ